MAARHGPLVSCESLFEGIERTDWVVFDCRHELTDAAAGPAAYAAGHVPGALAAHIDHDLSDPVGDGRRGRHPLPDPRRLVRFLQAAGLDRGDQVVAYDDGPGMWAGRLWWLLRDLGHRHVAVLDGGWNEWTRLGLPVESRPVRPPGGGDFTGLPGAMPQIEIDALSTRLEDATLAIIDARAEERFRGDVEPIDVVAGHIPGAVNLPFAGNLGSDGRFLSPDELRARFAAHARVDTVVYCGSGVTACHDVLAMEVAGLPTPALFPGSWSAWCHPDAGLPVARG